MFFIYKFGEGGIVLYLLHAHRVLFTVLCTCQQNLFAIRNSSVRKYARTRIRLRLIGFLIPYSNKNGFGKSQPVFIRRRRDSNPRWSFPHTNVPGLHLKPLGHLSIGFCVFVVCFVIFALTKSKLLFSYNIKLLIKKQV